VKSRDTGTLDFLGQQECSHPAPLNDTHGHEAWFDVYERNAVMSAQSEARDAKDLAE
jgi:hypothetical protein